MKKLPLLLAGVAIIAIGSAFTTAPSSAFSGAESQEFYIDDSETQLGQVPATGANCNANPDENCKATFTRQDSSSPWVLDRNTIEKGHRN